MSLLTRSLAALLLAGAGLSAQALSLQAATPSSPAWLAGAVQISGQQLALDATVAGHGSLVLDLVLDAEDVGQWLRFNAVLTVADGYALSRLDLQLQGMAVAGLGSVTPQFGELADVSGSDSLQTLTFGPAETTGLDLGAPFGVAGTQDWLLSTDGARAGDSLRLTLVSAPVPEPAAAMLLLAGLAGLGGLARRRRGAGT